MANGRCAHEGCGCLTNEEYCSEFCSQHVASGPTGEDCGCGHPECRAV